MLMLLFGATGIASADEASAAPALKDGWSGAQIATESTSCTLAIIEPAKRDYAAAAARAGDANPKPFPEEDIRGSVVPMCHCLILRAAETFPLADFKADTSARMDPLMQEAMSGGRCKPEGVLGKMLPGQQKP